MLLVALAAAAAGAVVASHVHLHVALMGVRRDLKSQYPMVTDPK